MYKELPVIPVNRVGGQEKNNRKIEGRGGGKAQGVADKKGTCTYLGRYLRAISVGH
jgi:hypothetical protein